MRSMQGHVVSCTERSLMQTSAEVVVGAQWAEGLNCLSEGDCTFKAVAQLLNNNLGTAVTLRSSLSLSAFYTSITPAPCACIGPGVQAASRQGVGTQIRHDSMCAETLGQQGYHTGTALQLAQSHL